jgi:signal transduction histidine kinase
MSGLFRRVTWRDWAVPVLLWVAGLLELWDPVDVRALPVVGPRWPFVAALTAAALALVVRRVHPVVALCVVVFASVATTKPDLYAVLLSETYMLVVAIFACGRYGTTPLRYAAVVLPEAPLLLLVSAIPRLHVENAWAWGLNALWIFGLGVAFRRERLLREQVTEALAAQSRAQSAEERVHLAREVHDVVSHSLSVVVVQAELARLVMTSDPDRAEQAMGRVQDTGRAALAETRRLLEALRDPARTQQVAQLPTRSPALTPEVSATAYRVVQESLTNALRHAGTSETTVDVTEHDGELLIDVQNNGRATGGGGSEPPTPEGFGLSGMRERVAVCGGTLTTGTRPEGGYRVQAVLPLARTR